MTEPVIETVKRVILDIREPFTIPEVGARVCDLRHREPQWANRSQQIYGLFAKLENAGMVRQVGQIIEGSRRARTYVKGETPIVLAEPREPKPRSDRTCVHVIDHGRLRVTETGGVIEHVEIMDGGKWEPATLVRLPSLPDGRFHESVTTSYKGLSSRVCIGEVGAVQTCSPLLIRARNYTHQWRHLTPRRQSA